MLASCCRTAVRNWCRIWARRPSGRAGAFFVALSAHLLTAGVLLIDTKASFAQAETAEQLYERCKALHLGIGGVQDSAAAREICQKAAEAGSVSASYTYASFLAKGIGGPQDYAQARYWYQKAAVAGLGDAMAAFGFLLQQGLGGPKDLVEARKWYLESARHGDKDGTNALGLMFEHGWGGVQNKPEASRLYQKAINLGEKRFAASNLKRLEAAEAAKAGEAYQPQKAPEDDVVFVVFMDPLSDDDRKAFLDAYQVSIVDGPNADGAYKLRLSAPLQQDQMTLVIDSMKSQLRIVKNAYHG